MAKRKTAPANSASEQGRLFRAAGITVEPPDHLRECDLPFWGKVISSKRLDSWTDYDLEQAANLAQTLADIRRLQGELHQEGNILDGKENPKHKLLDTLTKRSLAIARSIQIHGLATSGRSADQSRKNIFSRDARRKSSADDDGLIPGLCNDWQLNVVAPPAPGPKKVVPIR